MFQLMPKGDVMSVKDLKGNDVEEVNINEIVLNAKQSRLIEQSGQAIEIAKQRLNTVIATIMASHDLDDVVVVDVKDGKILYKAK